MPSLSRRQRLALMVGILVVSSPLAAIGAEQLALSAEENYVADQLEDKDCLSDWGANEGAAAPATATVTGFAAGGLRVDVKMPYAVTRPADGEDRPGLHADARSEAEYVVTPLGARRVDGPEELVTCGP